jgi:hypothetical protein
MPTTQTLETAQELSHAEENAKQWAASISAACEAVSFCHGNCDGSEISREAKAVLRQHAYDGTNAEVICDWIEDELRESCLSVEVRNGWACPGETASMEPEEFRILLTCGGPALRIRGELNRGEPCRCWLQHQDWGTPWTQFFGADQDALLWFASLFYYGEA